MKLKYYFLSVALMATACVGFTSCSDDDDAPAVPQEIEVATEAVRVKIGEETRIPLSELGIKGTGEIHAYSLDNEVAEVVTDDNGNYFIAGYKNGQTRVVITDGANQYKQIVVQVYTTEELKLNYNTLVLTTVVGLYNRVNGIEVTEGNGVYTVESNNPAVEATINSETGALSIVSAATEEPITAIVKVSDQSGLTADLNVTVSKATDRVKIGTDTRVAVPVDASLGEATVECLSGTAKIVEEGGVNYLEGLANGVAYVNILQGNIFKQLTYSVYTTDVMTLNKTSLEMKTPLGSSGDNAEVVVTAGNGGYSVKSSDKRVGAYIGSNSGIVTLTATSSLQPYTATITVKDCTGLTASFNVTVTASLEPFTQDYIESEILGSTEDALFGECKDPSDGTYPYYWGYHDWGYGEYTDVVESGTRKLGWWCFQYGSDYGGLRVELPETATVGTEVAAKCFYQYSYIEWYSCYEYSGTAKILEDNDTRTVIIWWNIDRDNERINRAYWVHYK